MIAAQKIWKEKKSGGEPIVAVFVCDVSGSMEGSRLNAVMDSLTEGSDFISPQNSIGLVIFNTEVRTALEIGKFDTLQKGAMLFAVEQMRAGGGTAMYDAIAAGLQMLVDARREEPDSRAMMFVLTDGESNKGLSFEQLKPVIRALGIPIYTVGYEADLDELKRVSTIVEATSIKADVNKIGYTIGAMLNTQM